MAEKNQITSLVGRILLSVIFLLSGVTKLTTWGATAGYMKAKGMPYVSALLAGAIIVELFGGLGVLLGARAKLAAWMLFLYLIPVTLMFHNFWAYQGMERVDNMVHFLKNLAIMGGLLTLAGSGAGSFSLDARAGRAS